MITNMITNSNYIYIQLFPPQARDNAVICFQQEGHKKAAVAAKVHLQWTARWDAVGDHKMIFPSPWCLSGIAEFHANIHTQNDGPEGKGS